MYTREQIEEEEKRRANAKVNSINQKMSQQQQKPEAVESNFKQNPFMSGVTGFNTAFERPAQGLMQLMGANNWEGFNKAANKREADYAKSMAVNPKSTIAGDVLGNIGLGLGIPLTGPFNALATKIAPALKSMPYLKNIVEGILGGGALGVAQYVEPGESRAMNALEGAGIGGGLSAALPGVGRGLGMAWRGISKAAGHPERMMKEFLKSFTPAEMELALKNKETARRIGSKISPAEAGDNRIASAKEARLGTSDEGQRALYEYDKLKKKLDEESIKKLISDISGSGENASEDVRNLAQKIIGKKEKALQTKAKPYYDAAKSQEIEASKLQELTNNGIIEKELKTVLGNKKYRKQIEDVPVNSIHILDLVKKRIDGLIGAAKKSGNKDDVRLYKDAKEELLSALDDASPDYKKARAIYSEESPLIDLLRKRQIGKIADLDDDQIKQVANIIFDSGDIDNKSIARMAHEFGKESPETWNRMIRNYMESKLDTSYAGRTGYHGTNFYNQFLAQDKSFNKLKTALSANPQAQKTLEDMREVFKVIQNQPTARGSANLARSHVDVSRSPWAEAKKFLSNVTGGYYDKTMVDIITTDKWQDYFEKALKEPQKEKRMNKIMELFEEANSITAKATAAKRTATEGPFMETEKYDFYD